MRPSIEQLHWMYETMLVIREYEETIAKVYLEGKLPPHIQKGLAFDIAAGPVPGRCTSRPARSRWPSASASHLNDGDTVVGTHRPHHFAIAKGVPLDRMTAEIFGKVTGPGARQGRPHAPVRPRAQVQLQRHRRREPAAGLRRSPGREEAPATARSPWPSSARARPTRAPSTSR